MMEVLLPNVPLLIAVLSFVVAPLKIQKKALEKSFEFLHEGARDYLQI